MPTVKQLQAQLKKQKLDTTGTKPELEARLASAAAAPKVGRPFQHRPSAFYHGS